MKVFVGGQEVELYTIGHAAKILRKSVETIRSWERQKIIPRPMYKNKNVRLYHPDEVTAMRAVIKRLGKKASKIDLQREMWATLKTTRKEILKGNNSGTSN